MRGKAAVDGAQRRIPRPLAGAGSGCAPALAGCLWRWCVHHTGAGLVLVQAACGAARALLLRQGLSPQGRDRRSRCVARRPARTPMLCAFCWCFLRDWTSQIGNGKARRAAQRRPRVAFPEPVEGLALGAGAKASRRRAAKRRGAAGSECERTRRDRPKARPA